MALIQYYVPNPLAKMTPTADKNVVSAKAQWILRIASHLLLFDLAVVVMTGGISLIGPVTPIGFAARMVVALGLIAFEGFRRKERFYAYLGLLLLLLPLLHFRAFVCAATGFGITPTRIRAPSMGTSIFKTSIKGSASITSEARNRCERLAARALLFPSEPRCPGFRSFGSDM